MIQITMWETCDGQTFKKKEHAAQHEEVILKRAISNQLSLCLGHARTETVLGYKFTTNQYNEMRSFVATALIENRVVFAKLLSGGE